MFYIHNVPGRVRIISEAIAKNQPAADEVRKGLSTLEGVCTVQINLTTGSILIHYNPKAATVADIVDMLEQKGYFDRTKAISNDEYFTNGLSRVGTTVVKTVIDTFIGRTISTMFLF
ncbi:MAG TPA: cation transporter [Syntrophales bacterium]|nr:cation transporter [Syntrophales bacterium]